MIDTNLLQYIKTKQAAGETREQITQTLIATGWNQTQIDEGFTFITTGQEIPVVDGKGFFKGRIGALYYFFALVLLFTVNLVFNYVLVWLGGAGVSTMTTDVPNTSGLLLLLSVPISILLAIISFTLTVRRAHDKGWIGWTSLLLIVPLVNIIYAVLLLFPGEKKSNEYGPVPTHPDFISAILNK